MEKLVKVNREEILHKLPIYVFLQKFYESEFLKVNKADWERVIHLIREEADFFRNQSMDKGMEMISELNANDLLELEYDFNHLFVGPNILEAPPYESIYHTGERALMQADTMAVRGFYEKAGLELARKNNNPDDHLALELEFICYLLEESVEAADFYALYEEFLEEHLFHWVEEHCELVRSKTTNTLIVGITYVLQGILEVERQQLNVPRRSKK
jgi:TorA maturation chaperone TorD